MEYFKLCLKIMQEEKRKNNLYEPDLVTCISQMSTFDANFERPYERCAYMYKYAACHLNFMKDCFKIFLNDYPKIKELLSSWKTCKNMKLCSMSHGPALDYLALTIALTENVEVELQTSFSEVQVISKSAQWKHIYNIMVEAIQMGYLDNFPVSLICDKIGIIQNNKQIFNEKQRTTLQDADILCMMKTLNFQSPDISQETKQYIKDIISSMKADSLLFCVDTKPTVVELAKILFEIPGEYVYEPVYNCIRFPEKFPDDYKEHYGGLPVMGARGWFFVWKKFSLNSVYNKIYPSILIEKSSSGMEAKTSVSLSGGIDGLSLINLLTTELNKTEPSSQANNLIFCDKNQSPLAINECSSKENTPMCSEISKETFFLSNQENSLINEIEKRFNQSLKITDDCILSNTMSNQPISNIESSVNVPSLTCDIENKFQNNPNPLNLGLNKQTSNLVHNVTSKKKSVKVGTDLKFKNEVSFSIQNLTNRIQKLVKSFENVISKNNQCNISKENAQCDISKENAVGESSKQFSCCESSFSCKSVSNYCQQNPSSSSSYTGDSASDSTELPSFQSTECNTHSNGTDKEAFVNGTHIKTHNSQCARPQLCCKCKVQNSPSQMLECNSCCKKNSCNREDISFDGYCEHSSHSGINFMGPNIIIPLQSINDDTLAQILKVLETASSKH